MKYRLCMWKHWLENILIFPFILFGRLIGSMFPLKQSYDVYFFFPFYHIGGAEKVHFQVAAATGGSNCIVYFTRKSLNHLYYEEFKKTGCKLVDISSWTDNKFFYFNNLICRGIISYHINRQAKKPVVFNGQCNFGYKISPWISNDIPQLELIHSLCSFSYIRIPFIQYYYRTVMISRRRITDHEALYDRYGIPQAYKENIRFILNGIPLPLEKRWSNNEVVGRLRILYVGRDTEEKRVDLIASVAKEVKDAGVDADFVFMGEVRNAIPNELHPYCTFLGNMHDDKAIHGEYMKSHILLMLSTTEGFPMAVMEGMARGLVIISTPVGEIPMYVKNGINGYLTRSTSTNRKVLQQAVDHIKTLAANPQLIANMGGNNVVVAEESFGIEKFNREYRSLFKRSREAYAR